MLCFDLRGGVVPSSAAVRLSAKQYLNVTARGRRHTTNMIVRLKIYTHYVLLLSSILAWLPSAAVVQTSSRGYTMYCNTGIKMNFSYCQHYKPLIIICNNKHHEVLLENDFKQLGYCRKHCTHLKMTGDNITRVEESAFDNFRHLASLNLSYNIIGTIDSSAYKKVETLQTLDLSHNEIVSIEADALALKNLEYLNVSHNRVTALSMSNFQWLYNLKELDLSYNQIKALSPSLLSLSNLQKLRADGNKLRKIQPSEMKRMLYLREANFSHNQLEQLDLIVFQQSRKLRVLDLSHNSLCCTVMKKQLEYISAVKILDLSHNNYSRIGADAFMHSRVEFLDISYNRIGGSLTDTIFNDVYNLTSLDLSVNLINSIEPNCLSRIHSLRILDVSKNQLNNVRFAVGLMNLKELYLQQNDIDAFQSNNFDRFSYLEKLDLSENKLTVFRVASLPSLKMLNVSRNIITLFNLDYAAKLTFLDMSHNLISEVKFPLSSQGLKYIKMNKNLITIMRKDTVGDLRNLEYLDLENNQIREIQEDSFRNCISLVYLSVKDNHIGILKSGVFKSLRSLNKLDLSSNLITHLTHGVFNGLQNLQSLNLSYNYLTKFDSQHVHNLKSLKFLILDGNRISDMDLYEISKYKTSESGEQLKIYLGENLFDCKWLSEMLETKKKNTINTRILIDTTNKFYNEPNVEGIRCVTGKWEDAITEREANYTVEIKSTEEVTANAVSENFPNDVQLVLNILSDKIIIDEYLLQNLSKQIEKIPELLPSADDITKHLADIKTKLDSNDSFNRNSKLTEDILNNMSHNEELLTKIHNFITKHMDSDKENNFSKEVEELLNKLTKKTILDQSNVFKNINNHIYNMSEVMTKTITKINTNLNRTFIEEEFEKQLHHITEIKKMLKGTKRSEGDLVRDFKRPKDAFGKTRKGGYVASTSPYLTSRGTKTDERSARKQASNGHVDNLTLLKKIQMDLNSTSNNNVFMDTCLVVILLSLVVAMFFYFYRSGSRSSNRTTTPSVNDTELHSNISHRYGNDSRFSTTNGRS